MNNVYFGIIIGVFLYFAGSRFLVVAVKAWKERKTKSREDLVEIVKEIINKE